MKTIASGSAKLTMISVPVVIAILLTLMLVLAALWVGTQPLGESEAYTASAHTAAASISTLLATHSGALPLAS